jgi:predicted small lipoprotein YifL
MKSTPRALVLLFMIALALAACGNKGDLVLPDPPPATAASPDAEPAQ